MKKVILTFEDDLSVVVEAEGFEGKGCLEATAPYEGDFGGVVARATKPEVTRSAARTVER